MAKGIGTFTPRSLRRRLRVHGFMARRKSNVLKLRRSHGRKRIAI